MSRGWQKRAAMAALAVAGSTILVVRSTTAPAGAQEPSEATVASAEALVTRWFVEMSSPPTAVGGSLATTRAEKASFRAAASRAGLRYREAYAFDTLWNGLSIEIDPAQVAALWRIDGVRNIYPVATLSLPESPAGETADLATALAMTGADVAQGELGLTGRGVRVAVMDSGIDYHHADLGGCFGPGCRVAVGYDFVGDAFNADPASPSYNPVPAPDDDPDDCGGHGTHVAGIVGGSGSPAAGGVRGVAPGVTFGAYRVFGCAGSTTADIMIAAMERALADGMQVLNMSLGSAFQWPQYPTAQASDRLVNAGVAVVASIGNSGAAGLFSAGAPGIGEKVIGVASFDNTHIVLPTFTVSPDGTAIGYADATAAPPAPTGGSLPMARTGTPGAAADACSVGGASPLAPGSLAGRAVLIRRGSCTFHEKSLNAQNAGAAAVVLYNNVPGRFSPTVGGEPAITIPVVAISDSEGVLIDSRLAGGAVTMTWTDQEATFISQTGDLISSFSSYGLSPDLDLKPDLGAPGGAVRSTYPLERGGYATLSGTSMSAPHTAGAVALLLEARPRTPSQAVRAMLQNSADPRHWWGNPSLGMLDNVHRQGAGMLDVPGAILATTRIEPGKLSLGESETGPATRTLTIRNAGASDVTYALSHAPALATNLATFSPGFFVASAAVAFSQGGSAVTHVTVPAGGSAAVDATISISDPPNPAARRIYGGYLVLTPEGGGQTYRVPYAGLRGDYQSIAALAPTPNNFPWLARLTGSTFFRQSDGASFTMQQGDVPYLLVHLDHQSRRFRVDIVEAGTGRSWHRAIDGQYFGRNSAATSFFAFAWDGVTVSGGRSYVVPNGAYLMRISVLKGLGDADNPEHWESWSSPPFVIARP